MDVENNENDLKQWFPRGSRAFFDANLGLSSGVAQPDIRPTVVPACCGKEKSNVRPVIRIVMYRVRLLDKDNAYGATKALVDCLREIGIISGDSTEDIDLRVSQIKVDHFNQEKTEVKLSE